MMFAPKEWAPSELLLESCLTARGKQGVLGGMVLLGLGEL